MVIVTLPLHYSYIVLSNVTPRKDRPSATDIAGKPVRRLQLDNNASLLCSAGHKTPISTVIAWPLNGPCNPAQSTAIVLCGYILERGLQ